MPTISGHVYYTPDNNLTPVVGIANVPVALRDTTALVGAIALTDVTGAFVFNNVPNGSYQVIETWGTAGGNVVPVNYPASLIVMLTAPAEVEPPLSALSVAPPPLADMLMAISPNLINLTVIGDVTELTFYDAPVGSKPVVFNGMQMVGPNLVTAAANGSFGSVPAGSLVNTIPLVAPYPTATPGLPYVAAPEIPDGTYSIVNIRRRVNTLFDWWNLSDHETMLETGRFMFVNGDLPGAILFTNTITVTPNTNYTFTIWGLNLLNVDGTPPRFSIEVTGSDDSQLGFELLNSLATTPIPVWYQAGILFNSGAFTSITIEVESEAPFSLTGNDYAIDEIRLFETNMIDLLTLQKSFSPNPIYAAASGAGQDVTVTVTVTNSSGIAAPNVFFQDSIDPQLQFVPGSVTVNGSGIGFATANPNAGFAIGNMAPAAVNTVQFHVTTLVDGPVIIPNTANATYDAATNGNGDIMTNTVTSNEASLEIIINSAIVTVEKAADLDYADVGDIITYTITVQNSGNVAASNVVLTDALPAGTTFVAGSLTGATGTPPTLTLTSPIPADGMAVVTYKVKVGAVVPNPNPVENVASAAFNYTVNPAQPNGASGVSYSNTVATQINTARLVMEKSVDKVIAYLGDTITYQIAVTNVGNVPASNVIITDALNAGLSYVAGSLTVSVLATGNPTTAIALTNPVAAGQTVAISFKVVVTAFPNPNPATNRATASYTYTVDPQEPNSVAETAASNTVTTTVFRNNFGQQISDLINSVALEQAALAALADAEGAKIQRMAAMPEVTPQQLLCLNKSVAEMTGSITLLAAVLEQKLEVVDCQINGEIC